jgi:hypothetical protein
MSSRSRSRGSCWAARVRRPTPNHNHDMLVPGFWEDEAVRRRDDTSAPAADLESAIAAYMNRVRLEAPDGVADHHALFARAADGWTTALVYTGGGTDLLSEVLWGTNRLARLQRADAAAYTTETRVPRPGPIELTLERRGARHFENWQVAGAEVRPRPPRPARRRCVRHSPRRLGSRRHGLCGP